jgi:hypothetical protein
MTHYKKTPGGVLVPFAPHIASGRYAEAEIAHGCQLKGEYMLTVRHADGTVKQQTPWFDNLITNNGLNLLGSGGYGNNGSSSYATVVIGQGTTAPSATDTALQSLSATSVTRVSAATTVGAGPNYVYTETNVNRFAVGVLNGNYTEVGIGWAAGNLFSRALILPDGVTAGSITVNSNEQLDVTYRISSWVPITDWGGVVNISGTNYTVTGRRSGANVSPNTSGPVMQSSGPKNPWGVQTYNGSIGAITGAPTGSTGGFQTTMPLNAYVNNSYQRTYSAVWQTGTGNPAGGITAIGSVDFNNYADPWVGHWQYGFSPAIPKDSNKVLTLNFVVSWARRP